MIGAFLVFLLSSLGGLALGSVLGELVRVTIQDGQDAVFMFGSSVILSGSYAEVGALLGAVVGGVLGVAITLSCACARSLTKKRAPPSGEQDKSPPARLGSSGKPQSRNQRGDTDASADLSKGFLLLHPSTTLKARPSQRLFVTVTRLQPHVLPVAAHMARIFGFQTAQLKSRKASLEEAPSNVACQVEHLCSLLSTRMQRHRFSGVELAFRTALSELHMQIFSNYVSHTMHAAL